MNVYKNVLFPQRVFEKASMNVNVKNVYFFYDKSSWYSFYIYYKTDRGDYVCYKPNTWEETEYLFTKEEFYDFSKNYYEQIEREYGDELIMIGQQAPHELIDVNRYTLDAIHTKNTNRNILIICIVVAVLAIGSALITVRLKKKKAQI